MSTDLIPQQSSQGVVLADYQTRAVQRLADWVQSADAAYRVARRLVHSSFVPAQFKPKGNSDDALEAAAFEATAAILAGSEVGLSPMASLRAFDVIQGTAAPRALTLRAIVQSFGHEIELVESTNTRCVMRGRRRGSMTWQKVTWTIDRAKDLGLTGKDQWKKQPGTMLVARCTSEMSRLIAADAILGIGYTAEEIADGADPTTLVADVIEPPTEDLPPATRRMSRPRAIEEPEPRPEPASDEDMITSPQLKKMGASMRTLGLTDRAEALEFVSGVVGREITTRNDLTKDEASRVIDRLERLESIEEDKDSADDDGTLPDPS